MEWVKNLTKEQNKIVKEYGISSKQNTFIKGLKMLKNIIGSKKGLMTP